MLFGSGAEDFSGQSASGISNASGTRSVRVNAQGLSRSCCKLSPVKIPSPQLAAAGSPRMVVEGLRTPPSASLLNFILHRILDSTALILGYPVLLFHTPLLQGSFSFLCLFFLLLNRPTAPNEQFDKQKGKSKTTIMNHWWTAIFLVSSCCFLSVPRFLAYLNRQRFFQQKIVLFFSLY